MPIDVSCPACSSNFTLKDELAGKKVRCSSCQAVIEVPAQSGAAVLDVDDSGLDRVFRRDKFLLNQKHLSINERYEVCDEKQQPIMHAVRPTFLLRSVAVALAVIAVAIISVGFLIFLGTLLAKPAGNTAVGILLGLGIPAALLGSLALGIWLAPKRHITFFRDSTESERLLEVLQDQKFTFRMANYTVRNPQGEAIGMFRKDYLWNIIRKRWDCFDPAGQHLCIVREDSVILSMMRRLIGPLFGLLRTNFVIFQADAGGRDGKLLGEFNRKMTILDRYVLDLTADRSRTFDRRLAIALGVLLDTGEKR
jgi:predicted Zn finger-like uncharacterized protein